MDNIGFDAITSTIDLVQENQLRIAPNPFGSETLVSWTNPERTTFQISLLNITGQVIRNYPSVNNESLIIERGDLLPGMYFLNFRDEVGNMGTLKLMVE